MLITARERLISSLTKEGGSLCNNNGVLVLTDTGTSGSIVGQGQERVAHGKHSTYSINES